MNANKKHKLTKHDGCEENRCFACAENLESFQNRIDNDIVKNGFAIVWVWDGELNFVHTVGLTAKGYPEIMLAGDFSSGQFSSIISAVVPKILGTHIDSINAEIDVGIIHTSDGVVSAILRPVDSKYSYMHAVNKYDNAVCMQLHILD